MYKASWTALSIIGVLLSATGHADDADSANTDGEPLPVVTHSVETLLAESEYASRWQLQHPVEAMAYSDDRLRQITDIDFQDAGVLARISMLRSLSLLTLAETGRTRLFLGVNENGWLGLHFRALPRYRDERHPEMVRMPYLEENEQDQAVSSLSY